MQATRTDGLIDPTDLRTRFPPVEAIDSIAGPAPVAAYLSTAAMSWNQGHWPGIYEKWLFNDPMARTAVVLYKLDPGVSRPIHTHDELEHLYVITGAFTDGHRLLRAGDYVLHRPDFPHLTACEEGCEMLLVFTPSDTPRSAT